MSVPYIIYMCCFAIREYDPKPLIHPLYRPMDLGVRRRLAIITCMDSRVFPDQIFGLKLGDAEYIRNAGGRVTDDVIRCITPQCSR